MDRRRLASVGEEPEEGVRLPGMSAAAGMSMAAGTSVQVCTCISYTSTLQVL